MQLQIFDGKIELEVTASDVPQIAPKLFLDSPRIVLSKNFEKYQEVHVRNDLFGSMKFMDVDDEMDVLTFFQNDFRLAYLGLGLPMNVESVSSACTSEKSIGELRGVQEKSFTLMKTTLAYYNKEVDSLTLKYSKDESCDLPIIEIAQDFYLVHDKGRVLGWMLKNCCQHICNSKGEVNAVNSIQAREILEQFFLLFRNETFDRMDERDESLRNQLESLIDSAKKSQVFCVSAVLEEWIEDNY